MINGNTIRVLSLSTPNPRRVHLMDENGKVLCDNNHLLFCIEDAHRGYIPGLPVCIPCALRFNWG